MDTLKKSIKNISLSPEDFKIIHKWEIEDEKQDLRKMIDDIIEYGYIETA